MLAIDPQGYFTILLWDETYHAMAFERHEYGEDWRDLDWVFHLSVGSGEVDISRMDVYSISGIRVRPSTMDWSGTWSMVGINGNTDDHTLRQSNGRITADLNIEGDSTYKFDGTAFGWMNDAGQWIDIMRGSFLVYPAGAEPGSQPGYFPVAWRLNPEGQTISASGHSGATDHCLKREGISDYPSNCYWYYYDRRACTDAAGDDSDICGWYGDVRNAGMEEEAGFPKPPGG